MRTIGGRRSTAYVASTGVREQEQAGDDEDHGGEQGRPRSVAQVEVAGDAERHRRHHHRHGQVREANLERVVAEDPLHVEGAEEEHPEHPDDEQRLDEIGSGDVAGTEEAQRHQRVRRRRLAKYEGVEQGDRDRAEYDRLSRSPTLVGHTEHRVDAEHQAAGKQRRAR
jgi:hypothetical protein